jgi:hypothetical protein
MLLILLMLFGNIIAAFGAVPILIIYFIDSRNRKKINTEMPAIIKVFLQNYSESGSLQNSMRKAALNSKINKKEILRAAAIMSTSASSNSFKAKIYDDNLKRFLDIALYGNATGKDISRSMILLEKRLNNERNEKLKIFSKIKSMQFISIIGIGFFFPMFSGISISIIYSYMAIASSIIMPFKVLAISYILIILMLYEALKDPSKKLIDMGYGILPIAIISSIILFLSSTYISSFI